MIKDELDFKLVVEPQEAEKYEKYGKSRLLVTPFSNLGQGSIPARQFVAEHSKQQGAERYWIVDDNIRMCRRLYRGKRIPINSNVAFAVVEDFTDRYTNIGISGMNYVMFVTNVCPKPFFLNCHVYSCLLVSNNMPYNWRGRYNEDTDLCLQVLSGNLCTVLFNAFMVQKTASMVMKGGNTDELYKGDGRLKMARSLERMWPGIVKVDRRFQRPQHVVDWSKFDVPLIRRKDIDWENMKVNEFGMRLTQKEDIKSSGLKDLYQASQ